MATTGLADSAVSRFDATTPPKPSSLDPKLCAQLLVNLDNQVQELQAKGNFDLESVTAFQRAANYLACAQIFLRSNALLERPLSENDIKRRLLGHWGTCPGLNFAYAHTNSLIRELEDAGEKPDFIYITGPGHGAPALLASLFLEGTWSKFYPQYPINADGFERFVKAFSFPGGFPSHVNAETPGSIHEGGELGYSLSVAYGSVMDAPDRISVVVVGDGESETGPTAAAWHAHKYIDPAESGAVLPILHLNGYKIAERTILGASDDYELATLFTGYGYQPRLVEYGRVGDKAWDGVVTHEHDVAINYNMAVSIRWALGEIRKIQQAARSGKPITKPRWPVLLMRTPKGWTGPKKVEGHTVEGSWRAHQVPLPQAATDKNQFKTLEHWLDSYKHEELFHPKQNQFIDEVVLRNVPRYSCMGQNPVTNGGFIPLDTPDWRAFVTPKGEVKSNMKAVGVYLTELIKRNPKTYRVFSPDEFNSNKLDDCFKVTHRNFQWDPETANNGGRVIEMLSEHTLQGFLQGYTLTGRHGLFPSYEAFLGIVTTMIEQYAKFEKMALETKWRKDVGGLTYIESSTLWRQEHNGYSHQNPGLIGSFLSLPKQLARIYFPADTNTSVSTFDHCVRSKNFINLIVSSKNPSPTLLTPEEAERHCVAGASTWASYSTDEGSNPDVVLVGCGVEVTFEVVAAAAILRNVGVRVRVVNVNDLLVLSKANDHPHALSDDAFNALFTVDKPVIVNFHGYPKDIESLLFYRRSHGLRSVRILGYIEEGTTTTPFSMLRLNGVSRYNVADLALELVAAQDPLSAVAAKANLLQMNWRHELRLHERYVEEYGDDPEWCAKIPEIKKQPHGLEKLLG